MRTLEKWQLLEKWTELKQPENIKVKAFELKQSGKSYLQIAKLLEISRVTVWRYTREAQQTKQP